MEIKPWILTDHIPSLGQGNIYLFNIDTTDRMDQVELTTHFPLLTADELDRFNKFRFAKDKYTFGIARYALRSLSARLLGCDPSAIHLSYNSNGMPYLSDYAELKFNISHSGSLILLGFGLQFAVGVDVEQHKPDIDHMSLSASVFSKEEIRMLSGLNGKGVIDGFYNCWSKKESFIKAKGMGLKIPLDQFSVRILDEGFQNLEHVDWDPEETHRWQLFNLNIKSDYAAACACHTSIESIECFDISDLIFQQLKELKKRQT